VLVEGVRTAWELAALANLPRFSERSVLLDDAAVGSDDILRTYVRASLESTYPVGTARMGPRSDPGAVVDQYGRVHGTEDLVVVDASVLPNIVRCNTNPTTIMVAERMADWLRHGTPVEPSTRGAVGVSAGVCAGAAPAPDSASTARVAGGGAR
jgi:choline dehydrogenase